MPRNSGRKKRGTRRPQKNVHHHHIHLLGTPDLEAPAKAGQFYSYDGAMYAAPGIVPCAKCFIGCIICPLALFCVLILLFLVGVKVREAAAFFGHPLTRISPRQFVYSSRACAGTSRSSVTNYYRVPSRRIAGKCRTATWKNMSFARATLARTSPTIVKPMNIARAGSGSFLPNHPA